MVALRTNKTLQQPKACFARNAQYYKQLCPSQSLWLKCARGVCMLQVCPNFLPDEKTFRKQYKKPIEGGRKQEATQREKRSMLLQSTKLKLFLAPIVHRVSALEMAKNLPPKLEVILVLRMPRALSDLYTLVVELVRFVSFIALNTHRTVIFLHTHSSCTEYSLLGIR